MHEDGHTRESRASQRPLTENRNDATNCGPKDIA